MTTTRPSTLTMEECCEVFRANNIPMTTDTLGVLLCEGKLPFGVATKTRRVVALIFKESLYQWLEEMMHRPAIRIDE